MPCVSKGGATRSVRSISVTDAVPNAGATDDEGKPADLSEYKDKNGVVLYMFPQADTPG